MKQNRDMFYSDYNVGGFSTPNPMPQPTMYNANTNMMSTPNMFNQSGNMMAAGPNVSFNPNMEQGMESYENRITKLERTVKKLESRVYKLESDLQKPGTDIEVNSSMYMI